MNVSVVIPMYNSSKYIERCVKSALNQSEVKEVIIVDDGSTDDSYKLCNKLKILDNRISIYQHDHNRNLGVSASRNLGMNKANEDYIAFLDSDDFYLPNRFKVTKKVFLNNRSCDGVYEAIIAEYENQNAYKLFNNISKPHLTTVTNIINPKHLFENLINTRFGYFSLDGLTIKKNCRNLLSFDVQLHQMEDTDFILSLSSKYELFPGSTKIPVAIRWVHNNNRIYDEESKSVHSKILWEKWYKKQFENDWDKNINRIIVKKHLHSQGYDNKTKKIYGLLKLLFRKPILLFKII